MEISEKALRQAGLWKKFMRLTRGRIPVLRTLEVIAEEETHASLKQIILSARKEMDQGSLLSDAIAKFPEEFSFSVIEMIKSAEKTGAWDEILSELSAGLLDGTFT